MLRVAGGGFVVSLLALLVNLILGTMSVNYLFLILFAKQASLLVCVLLGAFLGQFTIPVAVVLWVLVHIGLHVPLLPEVFH